MLLLVMIHLMRHIHGRFLHSGAALVAFGAADTGIGGVCLHFWVSSAGVMGLSGFCLILCMLLFFIVSSRYFFSIKAIPHFGHLPGLSELTSGCIEQV